MLELHIQSTGQTMNSGEDQLFNKARVLQMVKRVYSRFFGIFRQNFKT